jgi:superfamily I DNA and/or RNA helicase
MQPKKHNIKNQKLSSQILNYFATFTETRFNFRRTVEYSWKNDETTLDFSVFPDFQDLILEKVKHGDFTPLTLRPNQFIIPLPGEKVLAYLQKEIENSFSCDYLEVCIDQEIKKIENATVMVSDSHKGTKVTKASEVHGLTTAQEKTAWIDGTTTYNANIRVALDKILIHLQDELKVFLMNEYGTQNFPSFTFGPRTYINQHFENLQRLAASNKDINIYHTAIKKYFKESIQDIVVYDLYYSISKYKTFLSTGTPYLFFHSIGTDSKSYPLYFVEIEVNDGLNEILINFPRDLVFLNVPSVNSFKFENILTTPRSVASTHAEAHLSSLERFFQIEYKYQTPFIFETVFTKLLHEDDERPVVTSRIGLQIQEKEDKRLLDYSELLARLELGQKSQFTSLVKDYVSGTVPNFQTEVDSEFQEKFPRKSSLRYVSDSPIPLNSAQKRILLALGNQKNKIIVVDGPPGTGKSHTIAALTYYANENNKSVLITSYKPAALDVIDNMLTNKFNDIHPTAKPSLIRMGENTDSVNTIQNTLQSAVIAAATERAIEFNEEAIKKDFKTTDDVINKTINERLISSIDISQDQHEIERFFLLESELSEDPKFKEVFEQIQKYDGEKLNFDFLLKAITSGTFDNFQKLSIDEYEFITEHKGKLKDFLVACEKLHNAPKEALDYTTNLEAIPAEFVKKIDNLIKRLSHDVPVLDLSKKDNTGGVFSKKFETEKIEEAKQYINSLQFKVVVDEIGRVQHKEKKLLTLADFTNGISILKSVIANHDYKLIIDEYKKLPGRKTADIGELYGVMQSYAEKIGSFNLENLSILKPLFKTYQPLFDNLNIDQNSISSIKQLVDSDNADVLEWMKLHQSLSSSHLSEPFPIQEVRERYKQKHKLLEHENDLKLQELAKEQGQMKQVLTSFEGGKRFTREQVDILMKGISCVIADPKTISRFFPMDEDMIDILIIDEASQVSIADSISLMLRAKQVVVLGDEFQYGAVSAINVNKNYSQKYFHEIIQAYISDSGKQIENVEVESLLSEIGENISEDELTASEVYRPVEMPAGKIDWLKTFDIRTSTLAFAKAISNYSTSLKDHFRSFPEIIGYSNEFFYKPAQIELVVNRIRTKPIIEVLQFLEVKTLGRTADNTNVDEIEAIIKDIESRLENGFAGTIGIITSFKEQQARIEKMFSEKLDVNTLKQKHNLSIWFVGDVQGEERDLIYYSFVEDKDLKNASLSSIYPVIGGTADNTRSLKMQRLNVGFSRAKDTMVFVHSQPIEKYTDTRLGDALKHYQKVLEEAKGNDMFIEDISIFDSPQEENLYRLLMQTEFVNSHKANLKIIPQFPIGKYLRSEYKAQIPLYRTDFLLVYSEGGKEKSLILEYDGLEYHFKDPQNTTASSQEFIDYDVQRQLELEGYGYSFLRINKFTLRPEEPGDTPNTVLDRLLNKHFNLYA